MKDIFKFKHQFWMFEGNALIEWLLVVFVILLNHLRLRSWNWKFSWTWYVFQIWARNRCKHCLIWDGSHSLEEDLISDSTTNETDCNIYSFFILILAACNNRVFHFGPVWYYWEALMLQSYFNLTFKAKLCCQNMNFFFPLLR